MSKARLVITAVVFEGRTQAEVAATYGVSKGWWPATAPKARPTSSPDPDCPRPHQARWTRHNGRLHHIGVGRTSEGTCVILLVQDLQIRVVEALTGELLRELILNPDIDYQPTGAPKGPT